MVIQEFRCSMCGHRFEAEVLDNDDPKEHNVPGARLQCPECKNSMVNVIRTIRRVTHPSFSR